MAKDNGRVECSEYVTLEELYVHSPKSFKTKYLKGYIKTFNIPEEDVACFKGGRLGVSLTWLKANLSTFKTQLTRITDDIDHEQLDYFEVQKTLEKYNLKVFNPMNLKMNSTTVKYFLKNGKRTPYFTRKGLVKITIHFDDTPEPLLWDWIFDLMHGDLKHKVGELENVKEMVKRSHPPVVRRVDNKMVLVDHIYDLQADDRVIDFQRVASLKKDLDNARAYTCPLFDRMRLTFEAAVEQYEQKYKELVKDKVISHLKQELEKEKSLKDQAVTLTQSFIPKMYDGMLPPTLQTTTLRSISPIASPIALRTTTPTSASLRPSKM
jgi:hypothetical protein